MRLWKKIALEAMSIRGKIHDALQLLNALNAPKGVVLEAGTNYVADGDHGTVYISTDDAATTVFLPKPGDVRAGFTIKVINGVDRGSGGNLVIAAAGEDNFRGQAIVNNANVVAGATTERVTINTDADVSDYAEVTAINGLWFVFGMADASGSLAFTA